MLTSHPQIGVGEPKHGTQRVILLRRYLCPTRHTGAPPPHSQGKRKHKINKEILKDKKKPIWMSFRAEEFPFLTFVPPSPRLPVAPTHTNHGVQPSHVFEVENEGPCPVSSQLTPGSGRWIRDRARCQRYRVIKLRSPE